jgi:hypothetical protein
MPWRASPKAPAAVALRPTPPGPFLAVYIPDIDRPDIRLFPPENVIIDPAADWTNPVQSAAYLLLKYPMRLYEVEKKTRPFHTLVR